MFISRSDVDSPIGLHGSSKMNEEFRFHSDSAMNKIVLDDVIIENSPQKCYSSVEMREKIVACLRKEQALGVRIVIRGCLPSLPLSIKSLVKKN